MSGGLSEEPHNNFELNDVDHEMREKIHAVGIVEVARVRKVRAPGLMQSPLQLCTTMYVLQWSASGAYRDRSCPGDFR